MRCRRAVLALMGIWAAAATAAAGSVSLAGRMGERALLLIDGAPQMLAPGQATGGVRLLRWEGDDALVEVGAEKRLLHVGGHPASLGQAAQASAGREIVITAGPGGHFIASGSINGRATQFMVDTGATMLAMSQADARRLGIDLASATRGVTQTANGPVPMQVVTLTSVRIGDVQVSNVQAVVLPAALPYVLLGNSFLTRFQMRRENDVMRLELR